MMEEVERMVFQETVSAEMVRLVNEAAGVAEAVATVPVAALQSAFNALIRSRCDVGDLVL